MNEAQHFLLRFTKLVHVSFFFTCLSWPMADTMIGFLLYPDQKVRLKHLVLLLIGAKKLKNPLEA